MTQIDGKNYQAAISYIAETITAAHRIYPLNILPNINTMDHDKKIYVAKCMDRTAELIHIAIGCYVTICFMLNATYNSNIIDYFKSIVYSEKNIKTTDIAKRISDYIDIAID